MKKTKKLELYLYEGKLPELVAKNFEYGKIYETRGKGYGNDYPKRNGPSEDKITPARNAAIDNAVTRLISLVKRDIKKNPELGIELLADLNVTREENGIVERMDEWCPRVYVKVQAIGYKRKLKNE